MHGNMQLITELFKLDLVNGNIIKTCLEDLFQEMNNQNTEVLCNMLDRLTKHVVERSRELRTLENELALHPDQAQTTKEKGNAGQKKYVVKGSLTQQLSA